MIDQIGKGRLVAAYAAVCVLWGSTYLALALGLQSIPPFLLTAVRSIAGGIVLLTLEQVRRPGLPPLRAWASAAIGGLLLFVGCHGTLAWAQQRVPSGLAAVMLATIPLWIVLLSFVVRTDRRPRGRTLVGFIPGIAGVALLCWRGGASLTAAIEPAMVVLLLVSAFFWAAGSLVSQSQAICASATASAGMQLVSGGVVLLAVSALAGEWHGFSPSEVTAVSWAGLAYLTAVGSVLAFGTYVWLLDHAPAPLVSSYTFVSPVIAVILGWGLLAEPLTMQVLLGAILVIGSVAAVWLDAASEHDWQRGGDWSEKPAIIRPSHSSARSAAWPR